MKSTVADSMRIKPIRDVFALLSGCGNARLRFNIEYETFSL